MHERIKQAAIHVIKESQQARERWRRLRESLRIAEALSSPANMYSYALELKDEKEFDEQAKKIATGLKEAEEHLCNIVSKVIADHFVAVLNARKFDPDNVPIASKEEVDALLYLWRQATDVPTLFDLVTDGPTLFGLATYEDYVDWCHGERELDLPDEKQEDPSFQSDL